MADGKKIKVYISLSEELNEYFEQRARYSGQSKASVIGMALLEMVEQKRAIETLDKATKIATAVRAE